MMISEMFALYVLPTGRRSFALRGVAELAQVAGLQTIEAEAKALLEREASLGALEASWASSSASNKSDGGAELRSLDGDIDRMVSGIRDTAETRLRSLPRGLQKSRGAAIQAFLLKYFPNGVQAITNQSYPEEYEAVLAMTKAIRDEDAAIVDLLGLKPFLEDIEALMPAYLAAIKAAAKSSGAVVFKDLAARRAEAHESYCLLVAHILAGVENAAERAKVLQPVLDQQAAMRSFYSRRASVQDVDAETGEPVGEPAPGGGPAAPGGGPG